MKSWGDDRPSPFEPSERLHCPRLFHFGADDTNPPPADRERLDQELIRLGKQHECHIYPGAGHAFMNLDNPERYREVAAQTSWPHTLGFFARHLEPRARHQTVMAITPVLRQPKRPDAPFSLT